MIFAHGNLEFVPILSCGDRMTDLYYALQLQANSFSDGLSKASNELQRDGVIQRFKVAHALIVKVLQYRIIKSGIQVYSPYEIFREAARQGFLEDPLVWFDFTEKRNLTLHVYSQKYNENIFESMPLFECELKKVIKNIKRYDAFKGRFE